MMLVASVPIALVLGAGLLTRAMERSHGSPGAARALGASAAGLALLVTLLLWNRGVRGTVGTLDADPFSLYCSALLLGVLFVILAVSHLGPGGISRVLFGSVLLLLVIATRDVLWVGAALTLLAMSLFRDHAWAGFGFSAVTFWIGAILLVWFGGGSDLAVIGASQLSFPLKLGVGLMLVGVGSAFVVLNERSWALEEPLAVRAYLSAGVWVASTAALTRVSGWLDVSFGAWSLIIDLLAALALVIGSLIVLSSSRLTRLCQGFMLAQAGLALVAIDLGVEARSPLLLHLACGTVPLVLSLLAVEVPSGRAAVGLDARSQLSMDRLSRLVFALCWLSFTSLPPFPGFTAKFPILVALAGADKARVLLLLLLTTVLLAVGWTRWMSRLLWAESTVSSPRPRPGAMVLAALALAATLALGVLPETAIEVASRAAAGLF